MKILIRGAGDLATGVASRLYRAGHKIIMTEIAVPLTVRRMVALSRAIYEKEAVVEDMKGVLVNDYNEALEVLGDGNIPVIVDPEAKIREEYDPDVIIDCILAKRNIGTKITDAPLVIGVGPGFTAGVDCNCVVETKRGHTLAETIYKGKAIADTGIPGNIGGFSVERIIRATNAGVMEPVAHISDVVEKGQVVAITGGKEVYAKMGGIVRGMLQEGVNVKPNMKIGDIDARSELFHCFTISDKARAIGGGVLEVVSSYEHMKDKFAVVVLAAGKSTRFGEDNKLLTEVDGKPLYTYTLDRMDAFGDIPKVVVTGYDEIADDAALRGMDVVLNDKPEEGISRSIKMGLKEVMELYPDVQGVLFSVCDQPELDASTIQRIFNEAMKHEGYIIRTVSEGVKGNPVLWDKKYFEDLLNIEGDLGGKQVMEKANGKIICVEVEEKELRDIDYKKDIEKCF